MRDEFVDPNEMPAEPAVKPVDEKVTLTKAEYDSVLRDRDEARQSERYWANLARPGQQPQLVAEEPETDQVEEAEGRDGIEGDTPDKLIDEFASTGVKALKNRGFITEADAIKLAKEVAGKVSRTMIDQERSKITSDTQLITEFPELRDKESALFKETAKHYQDAIKMDPAASKTPAALMLAARTARAILKANGNEAPARRQREPEYDDAREPRYRERDDDREREDDRRRRVDAQDSRPRGRSEAIDSDDMMGTEAKTVAKAMGISEEEFEASRKQTAGLRAVRRR